MYNPINLHECEEEKKAARRRYVDGLMTLVGIAASFSSAPQVIKIWQTGDVSGISLLTYLIALSSVVAWFLYGLYIKNRPLVVTTAVSMTISAVVIAQLFWYAG